MNTKRFTLIELLLLITIFAIMVTIAVVSCNKKPYKASQTRHYRYSIMSSNDLIPYKTDDYTITGSCINFRSEPDNRSTTLCGGNYTISE